MGESFVIFLIAQSLIIVGAVVATYIRITIGLAVLRSNTESLEAGHARLSTKVDGISRAVGRLEGKASAHHPGESHMDATG